MNALKPNNSGLNFYKSTKFFAYTIFILLNSVFISNAQNLIPNGDFELGPDTSSWGWQLGLDSNCIQYLGTLGPNFWIRVDGSPDRLLEENFPNCNWDVDTAQSGKAYTVFGYKESGKTNLLNPLQKDSTYHLSYYVKLETFGGISFQPFRVAFRFNNSGDSLVSSFVSDTLWQYLDTVFIAKANASVMEIIGIDSSEYSGVDIDNLKLEKVPSNGIADYFVGQRIKIYPNPFSISTTISISELLSQSYERIEVAIYNNIGEKVQYFSTKENTISLYKNNLKQGIYFLQIQIGQKVLTNKLIINN